MIERIRDSCQTSCEYITRKSVNAGVKVQRLAA